MLSTAKHLCPSGQTLRGVYPERSEWAQGDTRGKQQARQCCHAERSEASLPIATDLRGIYPERSEWAQHDSAGADFIIRIIFESPLSALGGLTIILMK